MSLTREQLQEWLNTTGTGLMVDRFDSAVVGLVDKADLDGEVVTVAAYDCGRVLTILMEDGSSRADAEESLHQFITEMSLLPDSPVWLWALGENEPPME